ncbi:hypothetical protein [Sphingomonas elodea]|uniref:hypothetical protein n=1 Tax=Sphingomonas elodea TaxID=179878 RepID=UPI00026310A1|nr:hypothetical protein [Sphingomonas elodea]
MRTVVLAACFTSIAFSAPAAEAQTREQTTTAASAVRVADLFLQAIFSSTPEHVRALGDYLRSGGGQLDERQVLRLPHTFSEDIGALFLPHLGGSAADKARAIETFSDAMASAFTKVKCKAQSVEVSNFDLDLKKASVSYTCDVPDLEAALEPIANQLMTNRKISLAQLATASRAAQVAPTNKPVSSIFVLITYDEKIWVSSSLGDSIDAVLQEMGHL